jgi:hypothetical protein
VVTLKGCYFETWGYLETVDAVLTSDRRYESWQEEAPHRWYNSANRSCPLVSSLLFASLMLAIEIGGTIPRYFITDNVVFLDAPQHVRLLGGRGPCSCFSAGQLSMQVKITSAYPMWELAACSSLTKM